MYNQKFIKRKEEKKKKGIDSFLPRLNNKNVIITLVNGAVIKAKLKGYSKYELLIIDPTTNEEIVLFKHNVSNIKETS